MLVPEAQDVLISSSDLIHGFLPHPSALLLTPECLIAASILAHFRLTTSGRSAVYCLV